MATTVELDSKSFDAITSGAIPVLVDFLAPRCGICRLLGPVLEQVAVKTS